MPNLPREANASRGFKAVGALRFESYLQTCGTGVI